MDISHEKHKAFATKDEWLTPPELLEKLGPFDLDPCSPVNRPWPTAKNHYTENDNGLLHPWEGYVWCNPPYGNNLSAWINRCAMHGNGMLLIFARTDTKAFHKWIFPFAKSIFFLEGRIAFHHVDGTKAKNAGAPSVLISFGEKAHAQLKALTIPGKLLEIN